MLGLAALTLGGCATRRTVAPRSSGGAQAAMPAQGAPVPPLRPGGRVAIVAPASAAPNAADDAAGLLSRGYQPRIMPAARSRLDTPRLSGRHADARAADLHAAFTSADIDAVWCLQGGFGSWRLLDLLDYELLRRHAKPFIGYSDITALHLAIQRHAGFVTFHGPMLAQDLLLNGREEPTESALYAMVGGRMGQGAWIGARRLCLADDADARHGHRPAGGRQPGADLRHAGLAPRDRHARRHPVHRGRQRSRAARRPHAVAAGGGGQVRIDQGVLAGSFTRSGARDDAQFQYAFHPLLRERFGPLGIPVLAGWPSGHGDPNLTLPLGARVTLDATRQGLRLEQAAVTR